METPKKVLIIIHGAGPKHYRSLPDGTGDWQSKLVSTFSKDFRVITPQMPAPTKPNYKDWKYNLDKTLSRLKGEIYFVGHSLGGTFLVKYLLEEKVRQKVAGLFLVAAPYNTIKGFEAHFESSALPQIDHKYIYHCMNDIEVPFEHSKVFKDQLGAKLKTFAGRGHYFKKTDFPEIIQDLYGAISESDKLIPVSRAG